MSSRALKKMQATAKLEDISVIKDKQVSDEDDDDDDLDDISLGKAKLRQQNPFDLLHQQSPSESEFKEDDNETEHASAATNLPGGSTTAAKKKKKKRKKKTKHANQVSSEDNELTDKYMSDIDSLIGNATAAPNQHHKPSTRHVDKSLLAIELKHLNPQNEMRRTFGKRVVKIDNKRGRQKTSIKLTYMVVPKETWPPVIKNIITMKHVPPPDCGENSSKVQTSDNVQWFAFEHSQSYQEAQNLFLSAVERTDSNFLITLIRRYPYHVDSLIQLSELCKMTEDYSLANELIERALFVLESSLHPTFSLTSGNSRLDYRRQENRAFFIVLFHHAKYLEARACCRTALELSKLILNLSPEQDPLAMILVMDYYALRSKQYSWLIKFYNEYDTLRNLSQLPNMAYSYALALFCTLGECEKSDTALQYALLMFPGVLRPLLDEMSVQTDQRVLNCTYFRPEVSGSQSPALHQLVCLYVCRAKIVWRMSSILPWLERNVNLVLDRIDSKDEIINEYNQKRAVRYVAPPRPILRHVILSDYKEKVPLATFLTKDNSSIVTYDPLPPPDSINLYERKPPPSSNPIALQTRPLSMFFQSLLPSFNLNNAADQANLPNAAGAGPAVVAEAARNGNAAPVEDEVEQVNRHLEALNRNLENAAAEGGAAELGPEGANRDLSQSLTGLVDAMRDIFQNLRISENMQTADGEENDSSEEDSSDYID